MTDFTFPKSPAVVGNSLSSVSNNALTEPSATPAPVGIVGKTARGPAFIPYNIASNVDLKKVFGSDTKSFGRLASTQWFQNGGSSVVFTRVLGAGDCQTRTITGDNDGRVTNAGFVVGQEIVNTGTNIVGQNPYAGTPTAGIKGELGRTYFLAAFMSESLGATPFLAEAGIQTKDSAHPILRGVLFAPSGVVLSLSSNLEPNNEPTTNTPAWGSYGIGFDGGCPIGTINLNNAKQEFIMILNGHKNTPENPSAITASFDPWSSIADDDAGSGYFVNKFNTDATKIQEAGHYLYTHYDLNIVRTVITGSGLITPADYGGYEPAILLLTGTDHRNTGSTTSAGLDVIGCPNFENFEDRFSGGFTPYIVSQKISGKNRDLFRFYTQTDGSSASNEIKVTIKNIRVPEKNVQAHEPYCKFDIDIRDATDLDTNQLVLQSFSDCDLNPKSDQFISKVVGDYDTFYDFDASSDGRKIVSTGKYPLQGQYVRVEVSDEILDGEIPNAIPVGFRGIYHLVTSGSGPLKTDSSAASSTFNGLAALDDDDGTELILKNSDGTSVTFTTNSSVAYTSSGMWYTIGTANISTAAHATRALWEAFDAMIAKGDLKMTLTPSSYGGETEITLTQDDRGDKGNSVIIIPANITANGTTGAASGAFTGGITVPAAILTGSYSAQNTGGTAPAISTRTLQSIVQPPLPLRDCLSRAKNGVGSPDDGPEAERVMVAGATWGTQYNENMDAARLVKSSYTRLDASVFALLKFFPSFHETLQNPWIGNNHGTADIGGGILDADRFNKNMFTLENILVITGSETPGFSEEDRNLTMPDPAEWAAAVYKRNGKLESSLQNKMGGTSDKIRFFNPELDLTDDQTIPHMKFTVPVMGGYDGLNIFDAEKSQMTDEAVRRENFDTAQKGKKDSTTAAYRHALDIMGLKHEADMQLLSIPGIRQQAVTNYVVETAEQRFDALALIDIEQFDVTGSAVTGSFQEIDITNTLSSFKDRVIGSSFAAAYFPDVSISISLDSAGNEPVAEIMSLPPTVAAIGAIANSDTTSEFSVSSAPMGLIRGKISGATDKAVYFLEKDKEKLIAAAINPIVRSSNPAGSLYVAAQKTTYNNQMILDRINMRRLLIEIRRKVRYIARDYLFKEANVSVMYDFQASVRVMLEEYQLQGSIQDFRVVVDEDVFLVSKPTDPRLNAATTQDVRIAEISAQASGLNAEHQTIRGKVIIIPKASKEMMVLDFNESTGI